MTSEIDPETPPIGEEIHLPGPSAVPLICAIGITLFVVGTTLGLPWLILGAVLFLWSLVRWIRDTRRDVAALPDEHRH